MTQDDLTVIFDRLNAGGYVAGWGMTRHSDFDMLFNHERREWQRDRVSDKWLELKVLGANLGVTKGSRTAKRGQPQLSEPGKLIVVAAFDLDDEGNLQPAFEPHEVQSEYQAKLLATNLAAPQLGEYGDPVELARYGITPERK